VFLKVMRVSDDLNQLTEEEKQQLANDPEFQQIMEQGGSGSFPESPSKDNLLKLFRDIIGYGKDDYDKISKTGNLKDFEIGGIKMSVRDYLSIANFASSENLSSVASFLRSKSNVITNTSLSRSAKLLNLIVTQRRLSGTLEPKSREVKKGLFGETVTERGGEE